jgi:hypothetical protein
MEWISIAALAVGVIVAQLPHVPGRNLEYRGKVHVRRSACVRYFPEQPWSGLR